MYIQSLRVFFCVLFTFSALATAHIQKRSFSVERIPNPKFTGRNGPRALVKAYRKFGMPLPEGLVAAMEAQDRKRAQGKRTAGTAGYVERVTERRDVRRGLPGDLLGLGGMHNADKDEDQSGEGENTGVVDGSQNEDHGKDDAPPPAGSNITAPVPKNQTGSVPAVPEKNDIEYISPVKIGGQTVHLDFDTGSSDLWVFGAQLDANVTNGHRVYDPTQSKTFQPIPGAQFNITYGDGSGAQGTVGTDVVDVGGASFPNQAIELATSVSAQFIQDQNNDGMLGLAFSQLNAVRPQKQTTLFDNIKASLAEPVFTADLRKGATGSYDFGTVDGSKFEGHLTWVPVNTTRGFWQFGSERYCVNGSEPQEGTPGGQAIADTGTTLMLADPKMVTAYYALVQGAQNSKSAGGFTFPCEAELPDLEVDVGGVYMARVSGEVLNFAPVGNGLCFGGVQPSPLGPMGVYGDVFFKSQFVVFNGGNNTLGLALHK